MAPPTGLSARFGIDTNQRMTAQAGYVLEQQEWGGDPYIATSVVAARRDAPHGPNELASTVPVSGSRSTRPTEPPPKAEPASSSM